MRSSLISACACAGEKKKGGGGNTWMRGPVPSTLDVEGRPSISRRISDWRGKEKRGGRQKADRGDDWLL